MITRDLWTGCCKRKAEGYVYGTQRDEDAKRGEG
jgi:hypothetical protein